MPERLISEKLDPVFDEVDSRQIVPGAPLLPTRFLWKGIDLPVSEILEQWKESGPCRHGSGERYIRKHWFRLKTASGQEMKVYFQRQPRPGTKSASRWWLYSLTDAA